MTAAKPSSTQTVRVDLAQRSYDIEIGSGNLARAGRFLTERAKVRQAIVFTDENVQDPHAITVAESLVKKAIDVAIVAIKPGEASKSVEVAAGLWQGLFDLDADRQTVVVAVGGGVVGDLAGFVAATYARGLRFLQVPTSLLAQVDSSVGGKVGVNLPQAKNMVGAFFQPLGVLIDTDTLDTLPDRELRSGLGEAIKYGVILDAELFAYLEAHAAELVQRRTEPMAHVVSRCCRLKADVVQRDEREESGLRAVLNYGHTFGHALETLTGYAQWLHGEAVAIGMMCAARLANRLGRVDSGFVQRQQSLLQAVRLPTELPELDGEEFLAAMRHDKKTRDGRLRLVLPTRLGAVELVDDVDPETVRSVVEA
jgi:3-dehydroquinate synthase